MQGLWVRVSNYVLFLSYFLILKPSVDGFAELPATLVNELGLSYRYSF